MGVEILTGELGNIGGHSDWDIRPVCEGPENAPTRPIPQPTKDLSGSAHPQPSPKSSLLSPSLKKIPMAKRKLIVIATAALTQPLTRGSLEGPGEQISSTSQFAWAALCMEESEAGHADKRGRFDGVLGKQRATQGSLSRLCSDAKLEIPSAKGTPSRVLKLADPCYRWVQCV